MTYVIDTSSFLQLQGYYPETFPSFWERFDALVAVGRVTSVSEVLIELEFLATAPHLIDWINNNRNLFTVPSAEEMAYVAEIFRVRKFQEMIGKKQMDRGMAVADPWLVARGRHLVGCVVSQESPKENSAKVPNVCEHFGVECTKIRELMSREGWRF